MTDSQAMAPITYVSALAIIRSSMTQRNFLHVLTMTLVIGVLVEMPYFYTNEIDANRMSNLLMMFLIVPFKILIESMLRQLGLIQRETVSSTLSLFFLSILLNLIYIVGGLLIIVPFFVFYVRLSATYAIYLAEPVGMTDAISRSWTETRQFWGGIAKLVLAVVLVYLSFLFAYAFWPSESYETSMAISAVTGVILSLISVFVGFIPVVVYAHIRNIEIEA